MACSKNPMPALLYDADVIIKRETKLLAVITGFHSINFGISWASQIHLMTLSRMVDSMEKTRVGCMLGVLNRSIWIMLWFGKLTGKRQMLNKGYICEESFIQSRAQRNHNISNRSALIFTRCPVREEFVISFGTCQGSEREQVYAGGNCLTMLQGISYF